MPEKDPQDAQPLSPGIEAMLKRAAAQIEHPAFAAKRIPTHSCRCCGNKVYSGYSRECCGEMMQSY